MANIIDYIQWRGDLSFTADPFNVVDNLILARLSYIDFDDLNPDGESLRSITGRYTGSKDKMNPGLLLKEGTGEFFKAAGNSERFGSLTVKSFVSRIDPEAQLQFAAVTFELNRKTAYIAFRGTDDTLVGWKEDFNMSFMDVVPAQIEAASYLNQIAETCGYKNIYVGGHSKGGNLAVYSSVRLKKKYKSRIISVYNNDGPGFNGNSIRAEDYREIADRIITLIPKSSVVGLLLEHEETFRVVESNQKGLLQHEGLSWEVAGKDFVYLPELTRDARMFDKTAKRMLEKMSLEQRETFAAVLFNILSVNESKTLTELSRGGIGSLIGISENYGKMDRETKKMIFSTLSLFFDESYRTFLETTELDKVQNKFKAWRKETREELEGFIRKLAD